MRRAWISVLAVLILLFTGCSDSEQEQISLESIKEAQNGFYALSEDTCTPLTVPVKMGATGNELWSLDKEQTLVLRLLESQVDRIPVLGTDDCIILKTSGEFDKNIPFFGLTDLGSSLGLMIEPTSRAGAYAITAGSLLEGSEASAFFSKIGTGSIRMTAISGQRLGDNVVSPLGSIMGLEREQVYTLTLSMGSEVERVNVRADTRIYQVNPDAIDSFASISYENNGYMSLSVDEDTPDGIYYIDDINGITGGLFRLKRS